MEKQVVILVENDFEDIEFWYPYLRLIEAEMSPVVVGPVAPSSYTGKHGTHVEANYSPSSISAENVKAVVIPGGWAPDKLRMSGEIVELVRQVNENGGLVAGICHAGSVMVSAGILKGKKVTSYGSIKDDMIAAGAQWVDEPVVTDGQMITSRRPGDLPVFMKEILAYIAKM